MKVKFYFDEMMPHIPAEALRNQGYEVITASEVNMLKKDDMTEHLPFATERGMVVVTMDHPFAGKASAVTDHAGLICWVGNQQDVGGIIRQLVKFAETYEADQIKGQVFWLKE